MKRGQNRRFFGFLINVTSLSVLVGLSWSLDAIPAVDVDVVKTRINSLADRVELRHHDPLGGRRLHQVREYGGNYDRE